MGVGKYILGALFLANIVLGIMNKNWSAVIGWVCALLLLGKCF